MDHTIKSSLAWPRHRRRVFATISPNIQIDWNKSGRDRFSVPIGLGTIGLFRLGKVPIRWGLEAQYYVMQPDPVGPEFNLKLFFAPIIGNPFK